jgi:hypothetical protein
MIEKNVTPEGDADFFRRTDHFILFSTELIKSLSGLS